LLRPAFRAPFVAHWRERIFPHIRAAIAGAVARGELRDLPPGRVLRIVVSLVVGYVIARHILLPDLDWDDDAEVDGMIDVLFDGIGAWTAPRGRPTSRTRIRSRAPSGRRRGSAVMIRAFLPTG